MHQLILYYMRQSFLLLSFFSISFDHLYRWSVVKKNLAISFQLFSLWWWCTVSGTACPQLNYSTGTCYLRQHKCRFNSAYQDLGRWEQIIYHANYSAISELHLCYFLTEITIIFYVWSVNLHMRIWSWTFSILHYSSHKGKEKLINLIVK